MATGPLGARSGCQVNWPGLRFLPSSAGVAGPLLPLPFAFRRAAPAVARERRLPPPRTAAPTNNCATTVRRLEPRFGMAILLGAAIFDL